MTPRTVPPNPLPAALPDGGRETGRLVCRTPYSVELEEGLLRGIAQRFSDTGYIDAAHVETTHEDGMAVTTLEVTWWQSTDVQTHTVAASPLSVPAVAGD